MEFETYEPEIFAEIKPVVAVTLLGEPNKLVEATKNRLAETNTIYDYQSGSMGTLSSSGTSQVVLSAEWLRQYLFSQPAMLVVFWTQSAIDVDIEAALRRISEECSQQDRLVVVCHRSDQRDVIIRVSQVSSNSVIVLENDSHIAQLQLIVSSNTDRFYKEEIKKLRKGLSAKVDDPVFGMLRTFFKIAYMELFMKDYTAALKSLNTAYSYAVDHYQKLVGSEECAVYLRSVRWTCDAIAFRLAWLLIARGDSVEEYISGHINWFAASHQSELEFCRWKCKIYDAVGKLLRSANKIKGHHHAGYYSYLAAKNAMVLEKLSDIPLDFQYVEGILELLIASYDDYRQSGFNRMTMMVGRLIASQYMLLQNYEQAFQTLSKLRKTFRGEGWRVILGDILLELLNICKNHLNDPKTELECYWEYSTLYPERVMDDFDNCLVDLVHKIGVESSVIDMSMAATSFIKLAARFEGGTSVVGGNVKVRMMLCNMSPLVLSPSAITVRFTNYSIPDLVVSLGNDDVLPGTISELEGNLTPVIYGPLSIESATVDLIDLPIRLFFPASSLSLNDSTAEASWSNVTTNWAFVKKLESFTEYSLSSMITPIRPTINCTIWQTMSMIVGEICPLEISLDNQHPYPVTCTLRFSGNIHNVLIHAEGDSRLSEYVLSVECVPNTVTLSTIYVSRDIADAFALRVDCHSTFSETATIAGLFSLEGVAQAIDLPVPVVHPFEAIVELAPMPTQSALDSAQAGKRLDLVRYLAYISVKGNLPSPLTLHAWRVGLSERNNVPFQGPSEHNDVVFQGLSERNKVVFQGLNGHNAASQGLSAHNVTFQCLWPQDGVPITLKEDESYRFLFELAAPPTVSLDDEMLQPEFSLTWSHQDSARQLTYRHELPQVSLSSRSLFIVPDPSSAYRLGRAGQLVWRIWNMSDALHDVVLKVDAGDDYVYMGAKQSRHQIMPLSVVELIGSIVPLRPGNLRLPTVSLRSSNHSETVMYETLSRPPIFVRP
ncbi:hypothetical protein PSACC_00659 [Paramicrosporidium saccamoebae]|uniref:Trafficking protein particle complex subunit 11 domain-containing protein n=1 Tax=Paramicrosporidium saccamoebae TaxID=1246581 RepID=A0A2H9TP75_9FUNG|nr:hypothetical protein PSACC_00659 [Paramicrosporidium saccamoebae]